MVKTMLYKRTIALGISIDFGKDLRRSEPRGDSGGSGWRKEAVKTGGRIRNITEKTPREILTCDGGGVCATATHCLISYECDVFLFLLLPVKTSRARCRPIR